MDRYRCLIRRMRADAIALVGLVLIATGLFEGWTQPGAIRWTALGMTVPVLWCRRFPLTAAVVCFGTLVVHEGFGADVTSHGYAPVIAALVVAYATGRYTTGRRALVGAGVLLALTWLAVVFGDEQNFGSFVITAIIALGPWLAGVGIRDRQERVTALAELAAALDRERDEYLRVSVALERAYMARELHDVLAHSLTVMVVQAEAAEDLLEQQPQRAREALQRVQASGRAALHEARTVLATLRDREPGVHAAPGLADLEALIDEVRTEGLTVQLDIHGHPQALPSGKDVAAYRVVQEALTNILKHANAARAEVKIRHSPDVLELEISDDGAGSLTDRPRSGSLPGRGLVGMRERVSLYGGELQAGHHDGQGFVVRARIPVDTAPT